MGDFRLFGSLLVLEVALVIAISPVANGTEASITQALLAQDWPHVIGILEKQRATSTEPVDTLLMGHATLATNRNNVSYALFLSVQNKTDLDAWAQWTIVFLHNHPNAVVAHYLHGDARARLGDFDGAVLAFSKALNLEPRFSLARNARGVVYAITGNLDMALIDFYRSRQLTPELADTHANFGTLAVLREFSLSQSDEALKAFDKAIALNPDFALVYNSRGSLLFGSGKFEKASADFRKARSLAPFLLATNLNQSFAYTYANMAVTLASVKTTPGTTIESVIRQKLDVSTVTPTPVLNAISNHTQAQSDSSAQNLGKAVLEAQYQNAIRKFVTLSPAEKKAAIKKFGHTSIVMGLALEEEKLRFQQMDKHQELKKLNAAIPLLAHKYNISRKSEVWTSFASSMIGIVKSAIKGGAIGTTIEGSITVGRMKIANWLTKRGHPMAAKVVELAPFRGDEIDKALNKINIAQAIRVWRHEYKLDKTTQKVERLGLEYFSREAQIIGINKELMRLNKYSIRQLLDRGSAVATHRPIGLHSAINAQIRDITHAIDRHLGTVSPGSRIGVISRSRADRPTFSEQVLQSSLNRRGIIAPLIPQASDLHDITRQLRVQALLSSPTFAILQTKQYPTPNIGTIKRLDTNTKHIQLIIDHTIKVAPITPPPFPPPPGIRIQWHPIVPTAKVNGVLTRPNAFVDRGNWPVLTGFGLAYLSVPNR